MKTISHDCRILISDEGEICGVRYMNFGRGVGVKITKEIDAKIVYEAPEKKIEITESEFNTIFRTTNFNNDNDWNVFREKLVEKIFNKQT